MEDGSWRWLQKRPLDRFGQFVEVVTSPEAPPLMIAGAVEDAVVGAEGSV